MFYNSFSMRCGDMIVTMVMDDPFIAGNDTKLVGISLMLAMIGDLVRLLHFLDWFG